MEAKAMLQFFSSKSAKDSLFFLFLFVMSISLTQFLIIFWVRPRIVRSRLTYQGIKGPKPSFILGNIPEMKQTISASSSSSKRTLKKLLHYSDISSLFPYFKRWTKQFEGTFTFSLGTVQILYVADTDLVKEINECKSLDLGKPAYLQKDRGALLGKGLITTSGLVWLHQRKTIVPQLYAEKIKGMLNIMTESASKLVKSWEIIVEKDGGKTDIKVDDHIRSCTSYIISKAMFGSNFSLGIELFPKCRALMKVLQTPTVLSGIPLLRYLPTKKNKEVWRLEKEIYTMITDVATRQTKSPHNHTDVDDDDNDILRAIMESAKNGELGTSTAEEFVVDNCKGLYLAAFEVTAVAAVWGLMLLAAHPEWQERARQEVLDVCGENVEIDANMLSKMKVLRMVIQEVLRLYPVVAFVSRQAVQDVQLESLYVPKTACVWIWTPALHRDPKLWGPDAEVFNPERFTNGVSGACKCPQAYIPFGVGARICPGQNLAVAEMKVLFACVLSKFRLTVSTKYRHSPTLGLLLEPEHGVDLLVEKI